MVIDNRNADALAILQDAGIKGDAVDLLLAMTSCHEGCAKCPTGDAVCCTGDGPPTEERVIVALAELVHQYKWMAEHELVGWSTGEPPCHPILVGPFTPAYMADLGVWYAEYMKGRE